MLRILAVFSLITSPVFAAEPGAFDAERAIERYYSEFEDCRFHGADMRQPSCGAMQIYSAALINHGYCMDESGSQFEWVRCDALVNSTPE